MKMNLTQYMLRIYLGSCSATRLSDNTNYENLKVSCLERMYMLPM